MIEKTWTLRKRYNLQRAWWSIMNPKDITEEELEFLRELGCQIRITEPEYREVGSTSTTLRFRTIVKSAEFRITTTCEKQEIMLHLKYGDGLVFLYEDTVCN